MSKFIVKNNAGEVLYRNNNAIGAIEKEKKRESILKKPNK